MTMWQVYAVSAAFFARCEAGLRRAGVTLWVRVLIMAVRLLGTLGALLAYVTAPHPDAAR